jgi:phosphotransferase system enzyme I (PtsI)
MGRLQGLAVSPGAVHGELIIFPSTGAADGSSSAVIGTNDREGWDAAKRQTVAFLGELVRKATVEAGPDAAAIFEAQQMIVADPSLEAAVLSGLEAGRSLTDAVHTAIERLATEFEGLDNAYMRERAQDIRDIGAQLTGFATGRTSTFQLDRPAVLAALDLTPSQTVLLNKQNLLGIILEKGSRTSHTAILARSLGIPAVVAIPELLERITAGGQVIVDGDAGVIIMEPEAADLARYQERIAQSDTMALSPITAVQTTDGLPVKLVANLGSVQELPLLQKFGLTGIGLCRTEFIFLESSELPDEESQFRQYKQIATAVAPEPVVFRVLDIGGDKQVAYLRQAAEANPFLGLRGLRLLLAHPELLKTQLRALLRASVFGKIKVMFPMVATVTEFQQAMALVAEVKTDLTREGMLFDPEIAWGVMIEVPAAALISEQLAREVDFFSIGTNDLIQYTLAVDRLNERLNYLYQPCHPAVLKLLRQVAQAAQTAGIPVSVCGEMAGALQTAPLLLGLGITTLSMSPVMAPRVSRLIAKLSARQCAAWVEAALAMDSAAAVLELLDNELKK